MSLNISLLFLYLYRKEKSGIFGSILGRIMVFLPKLSMFPQCCLLVQNGTTVECIHGSCIAQRELEERGHLLQSITA